MDGDIEITGFGPVVGDMVKSKNGTAIYNGTRWKGNFTKLEPGQGYIYNSVATDDKTLIFPSNTK